MHVNKRGKDQMVKLQTHNDSVIDINGTCLQGYVDASSEDLVEQFGAPMIGDSRDKVEYEWNIMIGDQPISIYSWKNYGEKSFEQIDSWHVGGRSHEAIDLLNEATDLRSRARMSSW